MSRLFQYIKDTRREMAHVSWPTRAQTIAFTIIVVAISVFVAIYLSLFDVVFAKGLQFAFEHAPRFMQSQQTNVPPVDVSVASTTGDIGDITITPIEE